GVTAKIAIVILLAFFPIVINTYNGVLNTDKDLLEAATSFGASRGQLFTRVMLRAALSSIITGIRLGASVGILGVVVAELFTAISGLGGLIVTYGNPSSSTTTSSRCWSCPSSGSRFRRASSTSRRG
ncbi:MAG: ABC transporter permease, partial [Nitrososphaerales archaeon]